MTELKYWIWLCNIPNITNAKITRLINKFNNPYEIFKAKEADFADMQFIRSTDMIHLCNKKMDRVDEVMRNCEINEISIFSVDDVLYPERLRNIFVKPYLLYYKGSLPDFDDCLAIAVVGARQSSLYGAECGEKLAFDLAQSGALVVSGMARGIDSYAHRGALRAGGKTVAVLGSGLDICYPKENKELMYYIEKNGAVISEYPPGTQPLPYNFPMRNRIISGLCLGTLVVEAGITSGSLITADFALEQGRDVFAVPGAIYAPQSAGPNTLIKEGAKPVTCAMDIIEEYKDMYVGLNKQIDNKINETNIIDIKIHNSVNDNPLYEGVSQDEKILLTNLSFEPTQFDALCRATGLRAARLNSLLTMLEMRGFIEQKAGKCFVLVNTN